MTLATLEERVAALEKQVESLVADCAQLVRNKDWRRTSGAFTGDDLMKEVFKEGRKIREADRKRTRSRGQKKRQPGK
jgi:hypothetical protein